MLVYPYVDSPRDCPYWISNKDFDTYFDQHDFMNNRDVKYVTPAYRRDWFFEKNNRLNFILPVVSFVGVSTQFINGRHRVAVLLTELTELPIALDTDPFAFNHTQLMSAIPKRNLDPGVPINIPNFPFLDNSGATERY
jgi:hypothetical protein